MPKLCGCLKIPKKTKQNKRNETKRNETKRTSREDTYAGSFHAPRTGSPDRSFHSFRSKRISCNPEVVHSGSHAIWESCSPAIVQSGNRAIRQSCNLAIVQSGNQPARLARPANHASGRPRQAIQAGQPGLPGQPARPRHARDTEAHVGAKNLDFPLVFQSKVVQRTGQHG